MNDYNVSFYPEFFALPQDRIRFNTVVEAIDYSGDQIRIDTGSDERTATKVIVTVLLEMLQNKAIGFSPELPADKQEAIDGTTI